MIVIFLTQKVAKKIYRFIKSKNKKEVFVKGINSNTSDEIMQSTDQFLKINIILNSLTVENSPALSPC